MPWARHSSSSRPHAPRPSAVCDTARAVIFTPFSSTTQTPNPLQGNSALVLLLRGRALVAKERERRGWPYTGPPGGPLSLEPLAPFSCRPGQSQREPRRARRSKVLCSASSWLSCFGRLFLVAPASAGD